MQKQWKSALYVIWHSGGALLLLAACLLVAWLLGNDIGLDAVNDMKALEKKIPAVLEHAEQYGLEAYPEELTGLEGLAELETIIDPEELLSILRKRQILGAPAMTMDGMSLLIFILPGIILTPGLTKRRGLGRELQYWGRDKTLLSRMLLSWLFCFLLSSALYINAVLRWTDPTGAAPGQLLRNYAVVELFVPAWLCYSYCMTVLFRHTTVSALVVTGLILLGRVTGVYVFYPSQMIPYYNAVAYRRNTTSLIGAECSNGTFLLYCALCIGYIVVCTFLAVRLFRRRELQ